MDKLKGTHFPDEMNGRVFLAQYDAWRALTDDSTVRAAE